VRRSGINVGNLEVEELAGVLLTHLNSYGSDSTSGVVNQNMISQHNLLNGLAQHPEYPGRQAEDRSQRLLERRASRAVHQETFGSGRA
jgi:hypothetical protein